MVGRHRAGELRCAQTRLILEADSLLSQFTKVAPVTEVPTTTAVGDMDEEEEDPEDALARERAQAEREMFEADQERQRELQQDDETAGDIGSQLEEVRLISRER